MRTLKLCLFAMAAATLVLLVAACGGDGDGDGDGGDGGDGAVELPPPGEYVFDVTGTVEIRISEELVSAAPVTLQETQTTELSGNATIDVGPGGGTFNIPEFGISGTITIGGEDRPITIRQNPETPSTGEFVSGDSFFDLFFEVEVANADTIVARNEDPIRLEGDGPFVPDGPPLILETPPGSPPITLLDPSGNAPLEIIDMGLTFGPSGPGVEPDAVDADGDLDGEPALSPEEEEFRMVVGPFGMTPEEFARLHRPTDPVSDLIYSIQGTGPGLTQPQQDMVRIFAGIFDMTGQASQTTFGNTIFPCGTLVSGTRTVCTAGAGPVPAGDVAVLAMVLDGDVPMEDPDHFYTYAAVFDADGDPANNFQFVEPFNWDFFQNTDLWLQLQWDPTLGQWQLFVTAMIDQVPTDVPSNARVVIDGGVIVFFVPIDEFGVPRPGYRLTAFGHDGTFAPEASGGDVTGADPTEPLLPLPEASILIDEVEDVSSADGDELVPVEPPETIIE